MSKTTNKAQGEKNRQEILAFIKQYMDENAYSPSYREIMEGCGYKTTSAVAFQIDMLVKQGKLEHKRYRFRSLRVL